MFPAQNISEARTLRGFRFVMIMPISHRKEYNMRQASPSVGSPLENFGFCEFLAPPTRSPLDRIVHFVFEPERTAR